MDINNRHEPTKLNGTENCVSMVSWKKVCVARKLVPDIISKGVANQKFTVKELRLKIDATVVGIDEIAPEFFMRRQASSTPEREKANIKCKQYIRVNFVFSLKVEDKSTEGMNNIMKDIGVIKINDLGSANCMIAKTEDESKRYV